MVRTPQRRASVPTPQMGLFQQPAKRGLRMQVPLSAYLILSAFLFSVGVVGVATRRNALIIFMSIELMLNAVNLTFLAFARFLNSMDGQIFVFFVMVVAAAEVVVGLAIIIAIYRNRETLDVAELNLLKW
jgi:NADH-quinone oxidoreductase subunit K